MESKFTGGLLGLIGVSIIAFIITIFTFGIGLPWALTYKERWYKYHTYVNGRQLEFVGTGLGLFGQYIKWFILTIITLGIYGFWLHIKLIQWKAKNTRFAE